jgi:hypothetical protein
VLEDALFVALADISKYMVWPETLASGVDP